VIELWEVILSDKPDAPAQGGDSQVPSLPKPLPGQRLTEGDQGVTLPKPLPGQRVERADNREKESK
jgi:hypothetical protein